MPDQNSPSNAFDKRRAAIGAVLFLAAWGAGMALSQFRRPGGDSSEMAMLIQGSTVYYFRSPLTFWLHQGVFNLLRPLGWGGAEAIALCSSAAGGAYLLGLLAICRHPLFLAFNLISGTTFLFFGHVENYSWVNALLVLYLAFMKRHAEGRSPVWPAALTLFLACLFHMLAVFTLPTLAVAVWRWDSTRKRIVRRIDDKDFEMVLLGFVGTAFIVIFGPLGFHAMGLDYYTQRLVPL